MNRKELNEKLEYISDKWTTEWSKICKNSFEAELEKKGEYISDYGDIRINIKIL